MATKNLPKTSLDNDDQEYENLDRQSRFADLVQMPGWKAFIEDLLYGKIKIIREGLLRSENMKAEEHFANVRTLTNLENLIREVYQEADMDFPEYYQRYFQ